MAAPSSEVMLLLILLLGILAPSAHGGSPHINNLTVLLPPKTLVPVRYRLQGRDACFAWSWDHHDIISLEPEDNGTETEYNGTSTNCSTSAIISVLAPFEERQSTAIHARDLLTGEVLRREVFIDKLSRIQIFHHSVKLDLDGWANLKIRAFDAEENVFSSLVGLRFVWQLSPVDSSGNSRLLHVSLKDSPWSDDEDSGTQIQLEESGYGSDLCVVRGKSAGEEIVKARLVEPNMLELEDSLVLTVAEAEPHSPLHIIPGTSFWFELRATFEYATTMMLEIKVSLMEGIQEYAASSLKALVAVIATACFGWFFNWLPGHRLPLWLIPKHKIHHKLNSQNILRELAFAAEGLRRELLFFKLAKQGKLPYSDQESRISALELAFETFFTAVHDKYATQLLVSKRTKEEVSSSVVKAECYLDFGGWYLLNYKEQWDLVEKKDSVQGFAAAEKLRRGLKLRWEREDCSKIDELMKRLENMTQKLNIPLPTSYQENRLVNPK